jgi:hypothetical protein
MAARTMALKTFRGEVDIAPVQEAPRKLLLLEFSNEQPFVGAVGQDAADAYFIVHLVNTRSRDARCQKLGFPQARCSLLQSPMGRRNLRAVIMAALTF